LKTIFTLLIFICVIPYTSYCQESQNNENLDPVSPVHNKKELDSLSKIMSSLFYDGEYAKVIDQTPTLIKSAKATNKMEQLRRLGSLLGNAFIQLGDLDKADELFREELKRAERTKDTTAILSAYVNLGNTYINQEPKTAITHFEKALELALIINHYGVIFIAQNNLSELYIGINEPEKAQYYVDKALPIVLNHIDNRQDEFLATVYSAQGAIYLQQEKYDQTIEYVLKSLKTGENKYQEETLLSNYKYLIEAYDRTGQYKTLNIVRKKYDSLRDKRYKSDLILQQQIARYKFNINQYEQKLRASQLENQLTQQTASKSRIIAIFSLIAGTILLLLSGLLLFGRSKRFKLLKDLKIKNQQYLEAKEKSEKLAQAKTNFLSTISHELRTPLYGIIGLSSVLINNSKLKDHLDNLTSLKFSADYLLSLINDVLHLNKLESQTGQEVKNSYFKIEGLINSILQTFEFINQKNNNKIHLNIDSNTPEILYGDQMKISQVLMNLISNASKFTQDGTIDISIKSTPKENEKTDLLFCIKDTGVGIPLEKQSKIFDEFTQITNASDYQGTGLGLPIVNKILKILGSKLELESIPNKGSTFSFQITLGQGSVNDLDVSIDSSSGYSRLQDKYILIVEDNKINQVVTQKVLEQYDMNHKTANNGKEALAMAQKETFDAILMDINMPVMNGIDSTLAIRAFNKDTPIIALTATNYKSADTELVSCGINDSVVKPYKTEELLDLLLSHIN